MMTSSRRQLLERLQPENRQRLNRCKLVPRHWLIKPSTKNPLFLFLICSFLFCAFVYFRRELSVVLSLWRFMSWKFAPLCYDKRERALSVVCAAYLFRELLSNLLFFFFIILYWIASTFRESRKLFIRFVCFIIINELFFFGSFPESYPCELSVKDF